MLIIFLVLLMPWQLGWDQGSMWTVAWELYHDFPTLRRMLLGANRFHEALLCWPGVWAWKELIHDAVFKHVIIVVHQHLEVSWSNQSWWFDNDSSMILTCRWIFFRFLSFFDILWKVRIHLFPSVSFCFLSNQPQRLAVSGITSGEAFNAFASWQRTHYTLEVLGKHNTCWKIDDLPYIIVYRYRDV